MIRLNYRQVQALNELFEYARGEDIELIDSDNLKWVDHYGDTVLLKYSPEKNRWIRNPVDEEVISAPDVGHLSDKTEVFERIKRKIAHLFDSDIPKY